MRYEMLFKTSLKGCVKEDHRGEIKIFFRMIFLFSLGWLLGCHNKTPLDPKLPQRRIAPVLHVLKNGLKVVIQENSTAPVVAIQMWVNVGSADDPKGKSGLAHVLEHMVFKGTSHRAEGQIAKEIEGAGGQINAWTSFDQTVYHVVIASRFFERGLEILADALQNPRFDKNDLERELKVIMEEIKQGEDSPSRVLMRKMFATAYQKHPYRIPVIGQVEAVKKIGPQDIEKYFKRFYSPSNMTLVIVGDVKRDKALKKIESFFSLTPNHIPGKSCEQEPPQRRIRIAVEHRDIQEAYVSMAFHIPGVMDPDTPALDLAAVILGQGESSRLSRKVKHQQQLVTTGYSYAYTPKDPGLLVVSVTAAPDKVYKAIGSVTEETLLLGTSFVTNDELERAKTLVESDIIYQKETVQGQARKLGFFQTVTGDMAFEQEYYRRIATVNTEKIRQVAAKYLRPDNMSLVLVGPEKNPNNKTVVDKIQTLVKKTHARVIAADKTQVKRDPQVIKVTLANGAKLLVMPDSSVPLVAMRAVWMGGLRYENESNNGINSLLAALVTRGTLNRSPDQINETIEGMAGSISGFSGLNSFGLRTEILARYWEQGFDILADCILHPAFSDEEVERQRRALLDDILAQEDNLSSVVMRLFNRTQYKRHPYRMDVLGTAQTISQLSRTQLVKYFRRYFNPSGMVLAIVGDVDPDQVKTKFKELFNGTTKQKAKPPALAKDAPRSAPLDAIEIINKQQAHVVVGFPGTTLDNKDKYPLEVLAAMLSGQGGRLFLELRDRQGLVYQVGAISQEGIEPGYFAIYLATSPNNIQHALQEIDKEVKKLRNAKVSAAELKRTQRYLVGSYEISLQRKSTVASYMAFNECYGLGYKAYTKYSPEILAVTTQDIQRVARKYLDDQKKVVVMVKPEELTPGAEKYLGQKRQAGVIHEDAPAAALRKSKKKNSP